MSWTRLERTGQPPLPVTVAQAKNEIRVDISDDDDLIERKIRAAMALIEGPNGAGLALAEHEYKLYFDWFPAWIVIPITPVLSVDSIEYVDADGVTQTLAAAEYEVDVKSEPARIRPASGKSWPSTDDVWNAVTVTFTAGYAKDDSQSPPDYTANVPVDLKQALFLILGHWYENREESVIGTTTAKLPLGAKSIIERYRVGRFGC